jgi:hypothetical protein
MVLDQHPNDDVHMVLVHGIRTDDPNTWVKFRAEICKHLAAQHGCKPGQPSGPVFERLLLRRRSPEGYFLSNKIWKSKEEWLGSQPFIEHYSYELVNGRKLVLDEVNWWPLVLALKCQFIIPNDTTLVGPDKDNITHCEADAPTHRYGWFTPEEAAGYLNTRPVSGGAPSINRGIKTAILDWGFSDAILSLGTMKTLLRETVRCSFDDILSPRKRLAGNGSGRAEEYWCDSVEDPKAATANEAHEDETVQRPTDNFIIVSHSLGAFLLLDTFASSAAEADYGGASGACKDAAASSTKSLVAPQETADTARQNAHFAQSLCLALQASSNLYFLANQFVLIELGRAQGIEGAQSFRDSKGASGGGAQNPFTDALSLWAEVPTATPRQIVAFSDPGDLLTFKVPDLGKKAAIFNAYPKNNFRWFGIFEDPGDAHLGYLTSEDVLRGMFGQ